MDEQDLIDAALTVRQNAYCRYSNYRVGSALLDDRGQMYVGCNVENAAYPEGTCAEANAIAAMIAAGGSAMHTLRRLSTENRRVRDTRDPCRAVTPERSHALVPDRRAAAALLPSVTEPLASLVRPFFATGFRLLRCTCSWRLNSPHRIAISG
jgi:homotetrameric cytidine deaminase